MNNYMLERKGLNHRGPGEDYRMGWTSRDTLMKVYVERAKPVVAAARSAYYLLRGQEAVHKENNEPCRAVSAVVQQLAAALGVDDA